VNDAITVDAYYPADASSVRPVFVFAQGGLVGVDRYAWLLTHVASRGYVAVAAHHTFDLAFFEVDNPAIAYESALTQLKGRIDATSPVAVAGHSLGGVTAAWLFESNSSWRGLAFFASYPADRDVGQRGRAVLSISGATDKRALPPQVRDGLSNYADPKTLYFVPGMNHYAWTDGATTGELSSDGVVEGELEDVRKNALGVLDAWMDAILLQDASAAAALQTLLLGSATP